MGNKESDAYRAVQGLAEVFAEHQDLWWKDFLAVVRPDDIGAVRALSQAVQANDEGRYEAAEKRSLQAAALFVRHRILPGELRARFEGVYARRRILNGADFSSNQ